CSSPGLFETMKNRMTRINSSRAASVFASWLALFALTLGQVGVLRGQMLPPREAASHSAHSKSFAPAAEYPRRPSKDALKWADKELKKMSLDEKIGQLISIGINAGFLNQESAAFKAMRRQVEENHVGGLVIFGSPVYESVVLLNRMQSYARLPLLVSADLERGAGMRFFDTTDFGWVMAVGATGNPDYARRMGEITAREARALGVQHVLAPVVDVNNNAANPVINVRSYGEDPQEVGRYVAAYIKGAQHEGVIATAKHFPGHGNTATDSHRGLPVLALSLSDLNKVELVPFRAAVEAGIGSVMVGHIAVPSIDATQITPLPKKPDAKPTYADSEVIVERATTPASMSPALTGLLRRDLGFEGIVVTDALDMSGLTIYFNQEEAAVRAVLAGADMLLKPADADAGPAIRGLREAVKSGRVTEKRIEESARRILAAKYDLGLVKQRIAPIDEVDKVVSSPEAMKLTDEIAEHAITLVRNDAHLLPLNNTRADARIFNLAITNGDDRAWVSNPFVSALTRSGRRVETVVLDDRSSDADVQKALERAAGADLVIASLYGRVRTGQSASIGLPEPGVRALNSLLERNAPVIGISFGNPYVLQGFPQMKTYLVAYGDMPALQQAAARALLGEMDVTGRLPITLPALYARGTGIQLKAVEKRTAAINNK
ncbi:MAG TPA: glycoside hydrolase family 3 N-terminal domain-containing protein, partial [Pyrinomonadaceae bacterium]|nr:glycoside hydrolase family 3 N-terminal domain-containing protein [Pyrinomonadaceae bacterium]